MHSSCINLNKPDSLSLGSVRRLLASHDDRSNSQIRVTKDGTAFLSVDNCGGRALEGIAFRFETFQAGNGFTGQSAADDDEWVKRIHDALKRNWPHPSSSYLDIF